MLDGTKRTDPDMLRVDSLMITIKWVKSKISGFVESPDMQSFHRPAGRSTTGRSAFSRYVRCQCLFDEFRASRSGSLEVPNGLATCADITGFRVALAYPLRRLARSAKRLFRMSMAARKRNVRLHARSQAGTPSPRTLTSLTTPDYCRSAPTCLAGASPAHQYNGPPLGVRRAADRPGLDPLGGPGLHLPAGPHAVLSPARPQLWWWCRAPRVPAHGSGTPFGIDVSYNAICL
jgi:hypothetical protein